MTEIFAPEQYWRIPKDVREREYEGCGPGKIGDYFVPDSIFGVSITPACRVHDFMYSVGETIADKEEADRVFLNNMIRIVSDKSSNRFTRCIMLRIVKKYYQGVKYFGGPSFWDGKNKDNEMG